MHKLKPTDYLIDMVNKVGMDRVNAEGVRLEVFMTIQPSHMNARPEYRSYTLFPGDEVHVGNLFSNGRTLITVELCNTYVTKVGNMPLGSTAEKRVLQLGDKLTLTAGNPLLTVGE